MKYLFNISAAYVVEAESLEKARELLDYDRAEYAGGWSEITFVEEIEE